MDHQHNIAGPTISSLLYHVHGGGRAASVEEPNQAVEVRLRLLRRQIFGSPSGELIEEVLDGTITPFQTPMAKVLIPLPLPLHDLEEDLAVIKNDVVVQLISTLDIGAGDCEMIARNIASYAAETAAGDRERKFHIVAEVDIMTTEVVEEGPAAMAMEEMKIEEEEEEEEIGECSICLEELKCDEEKEVIEIPCGHVFHVSCIYKWLISARLITFLFLVPVSHF